MILAQLPSADYWALAKALVPVDLPVGMTLSEPGRPIESVYFPVSGLVSIDALTSRGESVQIGVIGREGLAGVCGLLGRPQMMHAVVVQTAGAGLRGRTSVIREEFQRGGAFTQLVHDFLYMQMTEMAQSVLCNRLHQVERRLARWLLTSSDRLQCETLQITQESMAQMLGARRSTVTVAAGGLQDARLIDYRRGRITIVDRAGLEGVACECYADVRTIYDRMLPKGI
jgi:CRP-like cAMP-binding protein